MAATPPGFEPAMPLRNTRSYRILLTVLAVLWVSQPLLCSAGQPADFEAHLELYRNGKLTGEMQFRLTTDGGRWTMHNKTEGTRGLASWIGLEESSTSEGDWYLDQPRPLRFERTVRAIKKMHWSATFDWPNASVHTVYPDGESTVALEPGVLDEQSIGLAIRQGLERGEEEWLLRQVDEDEIEEAHFKVTSVEAVQTQLGCFRAYVVEKIRAATSKRYTRTWYAADYAFVPIRMEHGKHGGDHIEGQVIALTLGGEPVTGGTDCPP